MMCGTATSYSTGMPASASRSSAGRLTVQAYSPPYTACGHQCRGSLAYNLVGNEGAAQQIGLFVQQPPEVAHAPLVERAHRLPVAHDARTLLFMEPFNGLAVELLLAVR